MNKIFFMNHLSKPQIRCLGDGKGAPPVPSLIPSLFKVLLVIWGFIFKENKFENLKLLLNQKF
tara:strand:+ start:666 stop:854 length:189 start_codon:yes stop_codon:yes gene_type:complete